MSAHALATTSGGSSRAADALLLAAYHSTEVSASEGKRKIYIYNKLCIVIFRPPYITQLYITLCIMLCITTNLYCCT